MLAVIYSFKVKQDQEQDFIKYWSRLTQLIYEQCGSLGSRLHKEKEGQYIAYAQWPDKTTFDKADELLNDEANSILNRMRSTLESVEKLHEVEMIADLTKTKGI
ncbi:antibiotic biosynthesis monooxygenase family protein [Reichenbachiella versicolor]|uniref:antibiotic biosynthesis monooxygenase family protein n=1 Tax=Reichenbachiella versicolor TaxID=1821036 RepID=UPI000D6E861B|nr:antibiotic biosynthesis monooxygenase [Reichenbachiella versicolor]